ncbi:MAG: hypothetical protein JW704_13110 [Anaerolineaceae bacterium]|nr:hypothetical protein [Anaerolineaceae bacterium]
MDEEDILTQFRRRKVVTIQVLADIISCSLISARRRLKKWHAMTSINRNGRYYTLPDLPHFDHHGLWLYKTILFSRHGNLKETMRALIQKSEGGLKSSEIRKIIGLPGNSSHLSLLRRSADICREKVGGSYIYFSAEPAVFDRQMHFYLEHTLSRHSLPSDAEAVSLLVQFIKHPQAGSEELSAILSREGIHLGPDVVRNFLEHHDLLKKTADTEPYSV